MSAAEETVDVNEAPQSRQRKKIAKEAAERKKTVQDRTDKVWYQKGGEKMNKLLKCTRMKSGNVHSEFVGMIDKNTKAQCDALLKKHPKPDSED